jgi:hypothetical protein
MQIEFAEKLKQISNSRDIEILQYERKIEKKRNKISCLKMEREVEVANLKDEIERLTSLIP